MQLLIRFARAEDEAILHQMLSELENEVLHEDRFRKVFLKNLDNENIAYFIAESHGRPVGMASCHVQWLLHHAAAVAEIQEMYVAPELRSQGIGRHLMEAIRKFAREKGARQIEVTSNRARVATHRFYEREGFQMTHYKMVGRGEE